MSNVYTTCEGSVPHPPGDFGAVGWIKTIANRLVDSLRVQQNGVVERADETVHLTSKHTKHTSLL